MPKLSKRLEILASLVPFGARVCDIGTDHGYLSIELKKHGAVEKMIATDINEKPLERAKKNIEKAQVSGIELRLCDGLSGIFPQEVDTVIIAGMGGEVISGILENGKEVARCSEISFILQPTTSPDYLRRYLFENGYTIESETPLCENGKLYSVMLCKFSGIKEKYEEYCCYIGSITSETRDGYLYIKKQYDRCFKCGEALKNIPEKQSEYNSYKAIADKLYIALNKNSKE